MSQVTTEYYLIVDDPLSLELRSTNTWIPTLQQGMYSVRKHVIKLD